MPLGNGRAWCPTIKEGPAPAETLLKQTGPAITTLGCLRFSPILPYNA
jgi:hypothetical protein